MTLPRQVLPGRTAMISRRCSEQRAFLRPTRKGEVNATVLWCQALAARDTGVQLHAMCAMPNHTHDVNTDPFALRPRYCQQLNGNLSRAMNVQLGRSEAFWASGRSYSCVDLESAEAVLKEIVYTITNPIRAGLVDRIEDYPGVVTRPEQIGEPVVVRRPTDFFRQPADDAAEISAGGPRTARDRARHHARLASPFPADAPRAPGPGRAAARKQPKDPFPDELTLVFTKPPQFAHLTLDQYRKLVRDEVDAETARALAVRRSAGRGPCLGPERIFAMNPNRRPGEKPGSKRPRPRPATGALDPRFAGPGNRQHRRELAEGLVAFWKAHRVARERLRDGDRDVAFPHGTWAAARVYGADLELFDP